MAGRGRERIRGMEIVMDGRSQVGGNNGGKRLQARFPYAAHAAEVCHQPIACLWADAGNGQQFRLAIPDLPPLAVVGNGEAV